VTDNPTYYTQDMDSECICQDAPSKASMACLRDIERLNGMNLNLTRYTHTYTQIKDKTSCSSVWRGCCCGRGHFACVRWSMQDSKRLNDMILIP